MLAATITASLLATLALAAPAQLSKRELHVHQLADWEQNITVHESCNATEVRRLNKALAETFEVAEAARDYILAKGPNDPVYQTYFGKGDWLAAIGAYEGLLASDKTGVMLRCDNIDGNCGQEGWNGHWRGENATSETVICPLSYETRKGLEEFCQHGYTVAGSSASYYFAIDLLHRMWHVPQISNEKVSHYADSYTDCLELAQHNSTWAPYNTHTLQYFAADVYARTAVYVGEGCTGEAPADDGHDHAAASSSAAAPASSAPASSAPASSAAASSAAPAPSTSSAAAVSAEAAGTPTTAAAQPCHTHSDGEVHCV